MNSKEALDKLFMAVDEELLYEQCGVIFATELTKVIEQDLDRLEQLEKDGQVLMNQLFKLSAKLTKYEKALDILKKKEVSIELLLKTKQFHEYNCLRAYYTSDYLMEEDYELLKEVLQDE